MKEDQRLQLPQNERFFAGLRLAWPELHRGDLFVIAESKLLAAHEPKPFVRLQGYFIFIPDGSSLPEPPTLVTGGWCPKRRSQQRGKNVAGVCFTYLGQPKSSPN